MCDSGVYALFSRVIQLASAWGSVLEQRVRESICISLQQSRTHFHTWQNYTDGLWANIQKMQVYENEETLRMVEYSENPMYLMKS